MLMQIMKNFHLKPADVARREKRGTLYRIINMYSPFIIVLFVLVNGCDTKNESANASGKNNPENVSRAIEVQKTINQNSQEIVEADSSISEAQKSLTRENSGIRVTFVELGSVNCIPCKMMQPIMKEIEKEYKNQVKVVFHDVWTDDGQPYAAKYRIRVIPTQVFLDKDGKEYFRHEGFFPKEQLVEVLKKQGVK